MARSRSDGSAPSPASGVAIDVRNVQKLYRTRDGTLKALDGISFEVRNEEFVTIVGPSGCGKTTLLRMLAGLVLPSSGEAFVFGEQVRGPFDGVGMVFQAPLLLKWRTVLDNVLLPIEILKLDRRAYLDRAKDLLRLAKIDEFARRMPRELSGGMQQRVSICRALIHEPRLLLMDEPFGALDALTRDHMNVELMRMWSETRTTAVLITHSIPEAVFLADRVLVMTPRPGRIADVVEVSLPRPRTAEMRLSHVFAEYVERISRLIALD